jgi:membrane protein
MAVPPPQGSKSTDVHYQPTRPLNRITLFAFKLAAENLGASAAAGPLGMDDPLVGEFEAAVARVGGEGFFSKSVDELLALEGAGK